MLKVFLNQKAFTGFSSMIPNPHLIFSPRVQIPHTDHHHSLRPILFSFLFMVTPPKADLLEPL